MSDAGERRVGSTEVVERLSRVETWCTGINERITQVAARLEVVSARTHDLATPLAILGERAEHWDEQHREMLTEIQATRSDALAAITKHDDRDDVRFKEVNTRQDLTDRLIAMEAGRREAQATNSSHRILLLCAGIGFVASLVAPLAESITSHLLGVHP